MQCAHTQHMDVLTIRPLLLKLDPTRHTHGLDSIWWQKSIIFRSVLPL